MNDTPDEVRAAVDAWHRYSERKREWLEANPDATPEQYENAMREIALECGV